MQWSVRAYNDWRTQRLSQSDNIDVKIAQSDLSKLEDLTKSNLCYSLCRFIAEVTKVRDGKDYPGKTLYKMLTSIQKYLHQNRVMWKILDDVEFLDLKVVLDNIMKEKAAQNIGTTVRQAGYIPFDFENQLWDCNILSEDTPGKLRDTVLFLLSINLGLRACDEHHSLRHDNVNQPSQISFK